MAARVQQDSRREEILSAQVRLLYANANSGIGVNMLAATTLALLQRGIVPNFLILGWWLYMILVSLSRGALARRYRRASPEYTNVSAWRAAFTLGAGLAGTGWGGAGILLYPAADLTNQLFLVFVLGGMMLGAGFLLAPRPEAFLAFLIPTGLAPTVRLLLQGDRMHIAMGLLAAVFTLATLMTTGRIYRTLESSLKLQFENRDLVKELEEQLAARHQFERGLQEKNIELENANRTKGSFLASMSHELRTPLNAIIGFTGILLMKLPGPLTEEQSKQLQTVRASAQHLLSLLNSLLDLAKIGSGKATLIIEPVVLQRLVEEVVSTLRPLAEKKGVNLETTVPEEELALNTDRRTLNQILLNLATNAIKFTEQGEVRIVLDREKESGKYWTQVSVHDTGIGIPPEEQSKIFQVFSQIEGSVRRNEGTGLGLHLSQNLAQLLGGQISFKSEYGKGSTFTLSLPES